MTLGNTSLSHALSNLPPSRRGPRCSVAVLLEELAEHDPPGHAALVATMNNHDISSRTISAVLHDAGHAIKPDTIRRHRHKGTAQGCSCS